MNINQSLMCPKCNGIHFEIKREATYLYTYKVDTPLTGGESKDESLPFLFDNRELLNSKDQAECKNCGESYPCNLYSHDNNIHFTIVQKAIPSDNVEEPQFLG